MRAIIFFCALVCLGQLKAVPFIFTSPENISSPAAQSSEQKMVVTTTGEFVAAWIEGGLITVRIRSTGGV